MSDRCIELQGRSGEVRIERDHHGVPYITAGTFNDATLGLGFCHARDRGLQLLMVRTLGQGRACEQLQDSAEMLELDRYFRRWNLGADTASEESALSKEARLTVEAYCQGTNMYFSKHGPPWELRLL